MYIATSNSFSTKSFGQWQCFIFYFLLGICARYYVPSTQFHIFLRCVKRCYTWYFREYAHKGTAPLEGEGGRSPRKKKFDTFFFRKIFEHFFHFFYKQKKILKIVWNVPKIFFIEIGRKKMVWNFFCMIFEKISNNFFELIFFKTKLKQNYKTNFLFTFFSRLEMFWNVWNFFLPPLRRGEGEGVGGCACP